MQVILAFISRIREDLAAVVFDPTQISVITWVLVRAVPLDTITAFIKVLPITVPATRGCIGILTNFFLGS